MFAKENDRRVETKEAQHQYNLQGTSSKEEE